MNKIKLSRKQKDAIYILHRDVTVFVEDFHHKTFKGLIKKGLIRLEEGSVFRYCLTELGKTIQL